MKSKIVYFFGSLITYIGIFLIEFISISFLYTLLSINFIVYPITFLILLLLINPFLTYNLMEYFIDKKWLTI